MAGGAGRNWAYERLVAVGLLGLVPTAFIAPATVVNYSLAVLVPLHGHWCVCVCMCGRGVHVYMVCSVGGEERKDACACVQWDYLFYSCLLVMFP